MEATGYSEVSHLVKIIENSESIIITSHMRPDQDAIGATVAMYRLLKKRYPRKQVVMTNIDKPSEKINFLADFDKIEEISLNEAIKKYSPQLCIFLDGGHYGRFSCKGGKIHEFIKKCNIRTIVIDHHTSSDIDPEIFDIFVYNRSASTTEEIYKVFAERLGWEVDREIACALQTGLISDTNRFLYNIGDFFTTTRIAGELQNFGADIKEISEKMEGFTDFELKVFQEMFTNLHIGEKYNYSFVSDEFSSRLMKSGYDYVTYKLARRHFVDNFINSGTAAFGFIVASDLKRKGVYNGSFRSSKKEIDCSKLAGLFGGGGHRGAAGFDFRASSVARAVSDILEVLQDVL